MGEYNNLIVTLMSMNKSIDIDCRNTGKFGMRKCEKSKCGISKCGKVNAGHIKVFAGQI